MIRAFALASILAAGLTAPALANDLRGNLFSEDQARTHLAKQGYRNISDLTKDENGAWVGTAVRDGKKIFVAVDVNATRLAN